MQPARGFSIHSRENLETADARLQAAAPIVLTLKDHSVIKGHRGEDEQNAAYAAGHSQLPWPKGNHNALPSRAIDVQTYPRPRPLIFGGDPDAMSENELRAEVKALRRRFRDQPLREEQIYLLGMYRAVLHMQGVPARTGADWNRNGVLLDNGFDDFFHVEIEERGTA